MAAKSVVEIDVQDEKFQAFLEKFNEYQKALEELPEQWRGAAQGIGDSAKQTEKVLGSTEAIAQAFNEGSPPSRPLTRARPPEWQSRKGQ